MVLGGSWIPNMVYITGFSRLRLCQQLWVCTGNRLLEYLHGTESGKVAEDWPWTCPVCWVWGRLVNVWWASRWMLRYSRTTVASRRARRCFSWFQGCWTRIFNSLEQCMNTKNREIVSWARRKLMGANSCLSLILANSCLTPVSSGCRYSYRYCPLGFGRLL